ncbi:MAG: ATP-binding protein [Saprospiraceae bacterium]|nr:ATP-binding protein [Saprospiraceae bacterium]
MEKQLAMLQRRLERERNARKQAESILEQKALELFKANEELRALNEDLENKIAERSKALVESEIRYKRIIENMELGLLEVDNDGKVIRAYDWFCDMTGYTENELLGKDAGNVFLTQDQRELIDAQNDNRKRGQAGVYELQIKKKNGEKIWVLISGAPMYDTNDNIIGSVGVHYDITAQKNLQNDLIEARKVAESAQQAEKQFLANMSHEIRTPLNAVIGMTHLLFDTKLSPKQKEYLAILRSSADLLKGLINDILDFSKIESGQMEVAPREFDLIGLLKSLEKTFQLKVEKKPVEVRSRLDPQIQNMLIGDDLMLNQILFNLVGNAIKFTSEGVVGVNVKVIDSKDKMKTLQFDVYDTGIGIPKKKQNLIFQDFKQVNKEIKLKYGGTGLGLAITKRLIEMQKGKIWVESEIGKGTRFSFTIPYEDTGREAIIKNNQLPKKLTFIGEHCRVLVAEDNIMNRKYINTLLKKWDINPVMAHDGQEAIEATKKQEFDIILMDIQMPEVDGFEATISIRNTTNLNQKTPIIALTASALTKEKDKAFSIGMNDFLSKPFAPIELLRCLNKHVNQEEINNPNQNQEDMEAIFSFNAKLDLDYLEDCYEGDLDYASDMFSIFIEYTLPEVDHLEALIASKKYEEIRKAAHKMKPAFAMVGLTHITDHMAALEQTAKEKTEINTIELLFKEVKEELSIFIPILKQELKKMQAFINK